MAQFTKVNADLKGVLNYDVSEYLNDAITFTGNIASATTINVTNPSSTAFTVGQVVTGPGVPAGCVVAVPGYAAGVLTTSGGMTVSTTPASFVAATRWVVGENVQPQGPKLQFLTVTITANCVQEAIRVLQKRSTVHLYRVASATELHVALYSTMAWDPATAYAQLLAESDGFITAAVSGATFA